MRVTVRAVLGTATILGLLLVLPGAATAAVTDAQRLAVAIQWTQPTGPSQQEWDSARLDQAPWAEYQFDWTTDYCTTSPDEPFGFDFRLPCQRHDFGYRNFTALGVLDAHKDRLDDAFHVDLRAVCDGYGGLQRSACRGLARTYYEAVRLLGLSDVTARQIDDGTRDTRGE
ncbi:phospholipase [Plantactinospora endophytica]|uniref:Phospholipase n=1 Tax=Plantactinospora endophytica TaxID=673535 RepID=A0ABQ4ECX4_9ACTN|nr:phospholipase [Plantactinospora endophytica]GIG92131.1 hypothetical protein Pen02_70670 [Plantactinospora endophytica]